jgi:hypothetical protein
MPFPDERLRQRSRVEVRLFPQGALLVDMNTGRCFRLNRVGSEIWNMLARPQRRSEICQVVASQHQMPVDQIAPEVSAMIDQLVTERLIEVDTAGTSR